MKRVYFFILISVFSFSTQLNAINALTGTTYSRIANEKNSSIPELKPFVSAYGNLHAEPRSNHISLYFQYNIPTDYITVTTASGGAVSQAVGMMHVHTGTAATASASAESKQIANYIPGHEVSALFTASFPNTSNTGTNKQYIGLFNTGDGFAIGFQNTTFGILWRRNAPTDADTFIAQTTFNLDPLDGTGPSGFIFSPTKMNIFRINFGWLGTAPIKFAIMREDGLWIPFHTIQSPNSDTVPTLYNPSLPMRVEVSKASGDTTTDLEIGTASWDVAITGFFKANRTWVYEGSETEVDDVIVRAYPVIFHNKTTLAGKTSTARVRILYLSCAARSDLNANQTYTIHFVKNPTVTNSPTYSDINTNFSIIEKATDATITAGTGTTVLTISAQVEKGIFVPFAKEKIVIDLFPDETLSVQITEDEGSGSGTDSAFVKFSIGWEEYY